MMERMASHHLSNNISETEGMTLFTAISSPEFRLIKLVDEDPISFLPVSVTASAAKRICEPNFDIGLILADINVNALVVIGGF